MSDEDTKDPLALDVDDEDVSDEDVFVVNQEDPLVTSTLEPLELLSIPINQNQVSARTGVYIFNILYLFFPFK